MSHVFLWMWLIAVLLMVLSGAAARAERTRRIAVAGLGISLVMLGLETGFTLYGYWSMRDPRVASMTSPKPNNLLVNDSVLGYRIAPGVRVNARKLNKGRVVYDVIYTVDSAGRRITRGGSTGPAWLFMGCSYTFGEGVNDGETLPSYFSADMGGREHVVNAAVPGYGPHQMLRLLELNRPPVPSAPVKQVIYQAIYWHVRRSAGRAPWDLAGPKYRLSGDTVEYTGPFRPHRVRSAIQLMEMSDLFNFFMQRLYFSERFNEVELELYGRVVEQAARVAKRNFNAGFTIVYWDEDNALGRRVLARLKKTGLRIVLVSDVIPRDQWKSVRLPGDLHPAPEANRRIALALAAVMNGVSPPE